MAEKNPRLLALGLGSGIFISLLAFAGLAGMGNWGGLLGALFWAMVCGRTIYAIVRHGRWNPYRFQLFFLLALGTLLAIKFSFWPLVIEWVPQTQKTIGPNNPICLIAIAGTLGNLALNLSRALFSTDWFGWGFYYYLAAAYLIFSLLLGRAWCSWACGYGAWDESFSRWAGRRPRWQLPGSPRNWLYLSASILMTLILIALLERETFFCQWICPFKLTEDLGIAEPWHRGVQGVLVIGIGLTLIVALPLLTGKRTFCLWLCPLGAWQRWAGKLNPFRLHIDHSRCNQCKLCCQNCPLAALQINAEQKLEVAPQCTLCGQCQDICAQAALQITWGAHPPQSFTGGWLERNGLFLFTAILIAGVVGLGVWHQAGVRIWQILVK